MKTLNAKTQGRRGAKRLEEDRTVTKAQEFCHACITDLNQGRATLAGETLAAFMGLCNQVGISTLQIL